ncbi:diguanylate cyclase [Sulfurimonas sp.]|uniref:sensor domain-containing diguanylate cyclase n=1 Tax=Sulfurimonas sp. TaxID=2022749 RepID=UPI0035636641
MSEKKVDSSKLYQIPIDALSINVAVYRKDADDFIIVDFNKAAELTEQLKKEDVIGMQLTEVFPNVREFGFFEVLERVNESAQEETFDLKYYEDERISGWRKNEVIKLPNGDVMAMYEDLTKEKLLEEKLKKLQFLGNILDSSINEIYIFTKDDFKFTYINRGAYYNIGYSLEEMEKLTPIDIKVGYTKGQFKKILAPLIDGSKKEIVLDTIYLRKDGTTYNVEAHIQLMKIDEIEQFVVIALDITQRKKTQLSLEQSEEEFRTIAESSLMGIFIYTDKFVYANKAFSEMLDYTNDELLNMEPWQIVEESSQEEVKNIISRRLCGEQFPYEYDDLKIIDKHNEIKIARMMTKTIKYEDGYAGLGTAVDVTDLRNTKQRLRLLAQAVEQTDELVMITDDKGVIIYVNEAYVASTGYKHNDLVGKNARIFNSGYHNKEFYRELWETISSGKTYNNVIKNMKKDKQIYYEEITITPIFDEKKVIRNYVATGRDITSRINMEEELKKKATTDSLTGIYNRYYGNEILDIEVDRANRYGSNFAVLMLDIDHFKSVNDTYGHNVGDSVLKKTVEIISLHMRKSDTFIRWGGEEFLIISVHIDKDKAMKFAHKLRRSIESYDFDPDLKVTISIGVAISKPDDTKENILKRSDEALYKAKEDGRNCVKYI